MAVTIKTKKVESFFRLYHSDALSILRTLEDTSVDSVCTDPPYGLGEPPDAIDMLKGWLSPTGRHTPKADGGFMGRSWDNFVPQPNLWKEVYRVLKPGGYIFCFAGTRTVDLMGLSLRIAGFEIRDVFMWIFGCLDEQTEVATKEGVKPYHETKLGDLVLCYDVDTNTYSYQPILEIVEYDYEDTAYRLVGDFGEQIVSRNHRCIVERNGKEEFCSSEQLQEEVHIPILENLSELQQALYSKEYNTAKEECHLQSSLCGDGDRECYSWKEEDKRGTKKIFNSLPSLQKACLETSCLGKTGKSSNMQQAMQRGIKGSSFSTTCSQSKCCENPRGTSFMEESHARGEKPFLERGCDLSEPQGCLCNSGHKVHSVPINVFTDGTEGRLCNGTSLGSSTSVRQSFIENGSSTSSKSRCNEQLNKESDAISDKCTAQEVRAWSGHKTHMVRVVPFKYTGKVWCLRVPTGAFVAVRNGVAFPTGNSGFPKGQNISKAMTNLDLDNHAKKWEGWNTQVKPANEPIVLARKPLEGTYVQNILKHGVGALNIDASRVELAATGEDPRLGGKGDWKTEGMAKNVYEGGYAGIRNSSSELGRYPTNVMVSHHEECIQSGTTMIKNAGGGSAERNEKGSEEYWAEGGGGFKVGRSTIAHGDAEGNEVVPTWDCHPACPIPYFPDAKGQQGSVSGNEPAKKTKACYGEFNDRPAFEKRDEAVATSARFFYQPKASKTDRTKHCSTMENKHVTVKPIALMTYLVRMITPKNGICLDVFTGSGTTGIAALEGGFSFIGVERDKDYYELAFERLTNCKSSL